jgi:hypothetical protein
LANIASDVDSLHVEIDNLNDLLVGFCFTRSIDKRVIITRLQLFYYFQVTTISHLINSLIVVNFIGY